VEPQPGERRRIAVEKFRWLSAHNAVKRGYALLAIKKQLHDARRKLTVATMDGRLRLRCPYQ
jgi:hypothetical protein